MRLLKRGLFLIVPFVLLGALFYANARYPEFVATLRFQIFDVYQRIKPRTYEPVPVKIVDIDEASLKAIGQWPWPRTIMAELISRIAHAGAVVVALDILLSEPDRTSPEHILPLWQRELGDETARDILKIIRSHDAVFAETIAQIPTVTGFVLTHDDTLGQILIKADIAWQEDPRPFLPEFSGAVTNLASFDSAAAGVGSFNASPDRDGINRRISLMYRVGDSVVPSFAAEVLRVAQFSNDHAIRTEADKRDKGFGASAGISAITVGGLTVPTDEYGRMWLYYTRAESSRYISAIELFEPNFDPQRLSGNIVFVGTSAAGLKDLRATPLNPVMPGVELNASVVEQVFLGHFLMRPGWAEAAEYLYTAFLAGLLIALVPLIRAFWAAVLGGIITATAVGASWFAYVEYRWLVDPVLPSLVVLQVYLVGSLINFIQTEAERRQVRHAFTHYLAPTVVEQLMRDPGRLKLGGEKRETTFLFSDIAGFTSLAEKLDPAMLVRLLNTYLDGTCKIVLKHGGTIDKIVGDALHVMFNAPSAQPDHADRAVNCALELDQFCQRYSTEQSEQGLPVGVTRVGVNTGTTVVGNFGGAERFDYTAHGDAINTAARLESVNKHLGTRICISDSTRTRCRYPYFRPVGSLVLKGKTEGLLVHEPLTEEEFSSERVSEYKKAFELLEKEDGLALSEFMRLSEKFPADRLIAFHKHRLEAGERGAKIVMSEK